jgi:hypothetical protein
MSCYLNANVTRSQVQTLWLTLGLRLQYSLPCSAEVLHIDAHSSLTESQETSLGADGLDVGTGEVVLLVDELVKIDVLVEGHFGGVEGEDLLLGRLCLIVSCVL